MKEKPGCVFLLYAGTRAVMSINKVFLSLQSQATSSQKGAFTLSE